MTTDEMRLDIIMRIVTLRKTKRESDNKSALARTVLSNWANGGKKPCMDILNEASFIIQISDNVAISCFDQEEALRKLAKDKGIVL